LNLKNKKEYFSNKNMMTNNLATSSITVKIEEEKALKKKKLIT